MRTLIFDTGGWYHGTTDAGARLVDSDIIFMTRDKSVAREFADRSVKKYGGNPLVKSLYYVNKQPVAYIKWPAYFPNVSVKTGNGQKILHGLLKCLRGKGAEAVILDSIDDSPTKKVSTIIAVFNTEAVSDRKPAKAQQLIMTQIFIFDLAEILCDCL